MKMSFKDRKDERLKFQINIKKDNSGYYVAEVPALPGCLSQGKTLVEAKVNIKEAIKGWLQVMNTQVKSKRTVLMIHAGLKDAKKGRLIKAREDYSKYIKRSN